ncbi:MAG: UDP-N-acetylmuramoyl-tripeptide--D-alanyl-D-alanine ligase [Rhodocyclaceae bacterium]|nr:UDP-N-acetylmuramoyl-tripeptide--D-alanyl-D-alanine ligase [Rhodocyclaceae bacterium]MCA3145551.1 UDP-N-acetylmuramoyl-tripeptide--D-alanyl-D-alanine ligase [Rhodocyclaceae bacterium]
MFRLSEAAAALGAAVRGPDVRVEAVGSDSRRVRAGELFVALRGERFDGHDYVDGALAAGAAAALVSDAARVRTAGAALLVVPDTGAALGALGAWWRSRMEAAITAVTGSNGKTTIKEMLAAILRVHAGAEAVLATEGNLNNHIGLPLVLLRLRARHRFAVLELGMNHLGEIAALTGLVRPQVAAIGNAGTAHIGELGSRDNIARAKGEIFEGLAAGGTCIINADDAYAAFWRRLAGGRPVLDFALDGPAAVTGRLSPQDPAALVLRTPAGDTALRLQVPGMHNVRNALCAAACAVALGVAPSDIAAGLSGYRGTQGRLQRKPGPAGAVLVDDTYNANPDSMKAALDWLGGQPGRRVFVMGDMGELGADAPALHAEVGEHARVRGIHALLALGEAAAAAVSAFGAGARHFGSVEALAQAARDECAHGVTVLVKGSRFMRMERVVERLAPPVAETAGGR